MKKLQLLSNEIGRGGLLLGLVMSGFQIAQNSLLISNNQHFLALFLLLSLASFISCVLIIKHLTIGAIAKLPEGESFGYMDSVAFILFVVICSAVWIALCHIISMQIIGYQTYIDGYTTTMKNLMNSTEMSQPMVNWGDSIILKVRAAKQPNILEMFSGTMTQQFQNGTFVALIVSFWTQKRDEDKNE